MMVVLRLTLVSVLALVMYLAFWPISIEPHVWQPKPDLGYTGPYQMNARMQKARLADLQGRHGPEDVAIGPNGRVWYVTRDGWISHMGVDGIPEDWMQIKGGKPLGLEFDQQGNLIIADAYLGLVSISPEKDQQVLTDMVNGTPILYADDLDITPDGKIWFSDATMRYGAKVTGSTLTASIWDLVEHQRTGRLISYDPKTGKTRLEFDGFSFANGVAVAENGDFLLLNETGDYRIWKIWLRGEKAGRQEILVDNLPGFPDNIQRDADGRFWFGLVSARNSLMDQLAETPELRKVIMRLPDFMKPKPSKFGAVFAIDKNGTVLANLQDHSGQNFMTTGAVVHQGQVFISSLGAPHMAIMTVEQAELLQ